MFIRNLFLSILFCSLFCFTPSSSNLQQNIENTQISSNKIADLQNFDDNSIVRSNNSVNYLSNNFLPKALLITVIVASLINDGYGMQESQGFNRPVVNGSGVQLGWNFIIGVSLLWFWIYTIVSAAKFW
jgi:hypothetical protein